MKNYGRTSVCEFLADLVVYRNYVSLDSRHPELETVRKQIDLPSGLIPRKITPANACLDDRTLASEMERDEIVITREVREIALTWREEGALLFGLSDKPDEASVPTDDLKAKGYRAIHQVDTHSIGG